MQTFKTVGNDAIKREFTAEHCKRLAQWFDGRGRFVHHGKAPDTRSRLWNCLSLLARGDSRDRKLAEAILLGTPVDQNHFEPVIAVELLLQFPETLSPRAAAHLKTIVRRHLVNVIEIRLGFQGLNNYSSMMTFFLLGAGQVLDRYEFPHELASIPAVYNGARLTGMGINGLRALAHYAEHEAVAGEFNSPTYSPITIVHLAKTIALIKNEQARELALGVEMKLWREVLALYHPALGLSCGPYARAYRVDIIGQNSLMRWLLCYAGLSKDRSIVSLLDTRQPGLYLHQDGDVPFNWSMAAVLLAQKLHLPGDALAEMKQRRFPRRFQAPIRWPSFGRIDPQTRRCLPVQGDAIPGGTAEIVQIQQPQWAVGYRTYSVSGHSFPLMLHYALAHRVRTMRDLRNVTAAVILGEEPIEWTTDQRGRPIEYVNFNHSGPMHVAGTGRAFRFRGQALAELASLPTAERSVNTFIPLHFGDVDRITLDGQAFTGAEISVRKRRAVCRVVDHGFVYEIEYDFPVAVPIKLYRWANFIRFAGFWYNGKPRRFSAAEVAPMKVAGWLRIVRAPGGNGDKL